MGDNVFSRSWKITKLTFGVIKQDKEILLFPIISSILSIIFILAMILPFILTYLADSNNENVAIGILQYVLIFILYLGLAFIATFFAVAVVNTAKKRFEGGNATFWESIGKAFSKIHYIFLWSLLSATVGLILKIIDKMAEKAKGAGKIILYILKGIFGLAWSLATIFVIQGIVYHNLGPFAAIKQSIYVLKKTWGESIIKYIGLGLMQGLFTALGLIIGVPLIFLFSSIGSPMGIMIILLLTIIYITLVTLIFNVANSVFNTALYVYATQGRIPEGYDIESMAHAFKAKEKKVPSTHSFQ